VARAVGLATAALLTFFFVLLARVKGSGRSLCYEFVPNKVHWVQMMMHSSIYAYWGWYWREVYHSIPLFLAQIVFLYGLDMLVCWSRRDKWILGFGPFPIVLSTNLFLTFRDQWFILQFAMIATIVLGKEFIRWKREDRLAHIFNPSAFGLFIFSVALIATKSTSMSWGIEIADTLHRPPHIYLEIFLVGLIVQGLFQVTLVTLFSAAALFASNLVYTGMTGDYYFIDSYIPVSVFLGLHLLVTDPATSPRRPFAKIIFGTLYGVGVFGMYRLLSLVGAPEFYDKLLCVPILNLSVRVLDRLSAALAVTFRPMLPLHLPQWSKQKSNFAWMTVWVSLFITMVSTGFLAKGKDHPGGNPEHWHQACLQGNHKACDTWVRTLNVNCQDDRGADCVLLGTVLNEGRLVTRRADLAGVAFGHGCDLQAAGACDKLTAFAAADGRATFQNSCDHGDGASCFVLGSLYSSGSGVPKDDARAFALFGRSCDLEWWRGCGRLAVSYMVGQGTRPNPFLAIENFEKGCQGSNAASCFEVAKLYVRRNWGVQDRELARKRFRRACDLGIREACQIADAPTRASNSKAPVPPTP